MNDYLWIRDTIPRQRLSNSSGSRTKSRLYDNANGERERQGSGGEEEEGEGEGRRNWKWLWQHASHKPKNTVASALRNTEYLISSAERSSSIV